MSSITTVTGIPSHSFSNHQEEIKARIDSMPYLHEITRYFPPETLSPNDRVEIGVLVLEKYGEAEFAFYQRSYRLTQEEYDFIFTQTNDYAKDLATWEVLDKERYQEEINVIREHFPEAKFSLLKTREENHRSHPIVTIEDKHYYFYSEAFKGPVVDDSYITKYQQCQEQENRPNFKVLGSKSTKMVFLMEFMGEKTPDFRKESHLDLLLELIVKKSLNKKCLDMLPCRLAVVDQNLYCVDQKLNYGTCETEFEAFTTNISYLKSKIQYRGYAEEEYLLAYVDKIAQRHLTCIFEKMIQGKYTFQIPEILPPASLRNDEKLALATATLRILGTSQLCYIARDYQLCIEDQKQAKRLAGEGLIENTVIWNDEISERFEELHQKTTIALEKQGLQGKFATYQNKIGNYKTVLTVCIEKDTYVVYEVDEKYIEEFKNRKEQEHRPDFRTFALEDGSFLFLSKFMGSEPIDYSNPEHLDKITDLAMNFSSDPKSTIDFNYGNLLLADNKVFYIDKDLTYTQSKNPRLFNLKAIFHSIETNLHVEHERTLSKKRVKDKIRPLLSAENPQDLKILKTFFPETQSKAPLFEAFLATIDFDTPGNPMKLLDTLPVFFTTLEDCKNKGNWTVMIGQKLLKSEYAKSLGSQYLQVVIQLIEQLSEKVLNAEG